jgi:glycosyltransferase involved in cell wall biosynthesis
MQRTANIIHFATWFPKFSGDIEGVFTKRQIELLKSSRIHQRHVVIVKSYWNMSFWELIKCFFGHFPKKEIDGLLIYYFPNDDSFRKRIIHRLREYIWTWMLWVIKIKFNPTISHLHVTYGFAREVLFLKEKFNISFIVSEHCAPFPFPWITDKETLVLQPIKNASHVVAVSNAQASQIQLLVQREIDVIPNVVSSKQFFYKSTTKYIGINIVIVGIYESRKGLDYFIETFPMILQQHSNVKVHLVGHATESRLDKINSRLTELDILPFFHFHGILSPEHLNNLNNNCDFHLCASEWESFGVAVLESLFSGLPVLATNCGGVADFLLDDNSIMIDNDRDVNTLLRGFSQMVEKLPTFDSIRISNEVKKRFDNKNITDKYNKLYCDI